MMLRPLSLFGPSPGGGRQQLCRELAAVHRLILGLPRDTGCGFSDGLQGRVAELSEDVVAAFEQFARERETRAVAADPLRQPGRSTRGRGWLGNRAR